MYLNFGGKRWRYRRRRLAQGTYGHCKIPPDSTAGRIIEVDSRLKGKAELTTIVHEMLHATYWEFGEDFVERASSDIATGLWRMGYRRQQ